MRIPIGKLKHDVSIEKNESDSRDDFNAPISEWTEFARRYAEIKPTGGREVQVGNTTTADATHKITMRYVAVEPKDRITFNGRTFEVLAVDHGDQRSIDTVATVMEIV